jgi:hypothetical protein
MWSLDSFDVLDSVRIFFTLFWFPQKINLPITTNGYRSEEDMRKDRIR